MRKHAMRFGGNHQAKVAQSGKNNVIGGHITLPENAIYVKGFYTKPDLIR